MIGQLPAAKIDGSMIQADANRQRAVNIPDSIDWGPAEKQS